MKRMKLRKTLLAAALVGATALGTTALVSAQPGGYGPGYGMGPGMMGPGMMGGYGPGPGGGYGPGYGMGPGMMGGGMMGGMMGGYGMGPGMMGPGMMGPGMMGGGMGYVLYQLNLSPDQWNKANAIHEDLAKKNWDLAGKTREEAFKLRNLMTAEKRDSHAVTNQYKKLQELRLQSFQARLDALERIDGVLTKEQKGQLRRFAPWWGQDVE
jgi:Spy/CpxP family protein refolding chaperone